MSAGPSRLVRLVPALGMLVVLATLVPSPPPAAAAAVPAPVSAGGWRWDYVWKPWYQNGKVAKQFAVTIEGDRLGTPDRGTGLGLTERNQNHRLGGRYIGPDHYIEYQDVAGPYNATDPLYGKELGFPSRWLKAPGASLAYKRQVCAGFLGNNPNHPQMANCIAAGPISEDVAPYGYPWPAFLDAVWFDVADESSWVYKPPRPEAPAGSWHIKTTNFITFVGTRTPAAGPPPTTTTVPKAGGPGGGGGGGGGGGAGGGPAPADTVTIDVTGYEVGHATGSFAPGRLRVATAPLTCDGGHAPPCGRAVPGAAGPLVSLPTPSSGSSGPYPDRLTLSSLGLQPPPGYTEGDLYAGGEYKTTVPYDPGANLWAGPAGTEHVFFQATVAGQEYRIVVGTPAAAVHWIDWGYDSRPTATCPVADTVVKDKKGKVTAVYKNPPIPCQYRWFLTASYRYGYAPTEVHVGPGTTFPVIRSISR